jgi:hypothetical protein
LETQVVQAAMTQGEQMAQLCTKHDEEIQRLERLAVAHEEHCKLMWRAMVPLEEKVELLQQLKDEQDARMADASCA